MTAGGGVSTRRRLCGPGLIGRTGSINGACGRERGDCAGYAVGEETGKGVSVRGGDGVTLGGGGVCNATGETVAAGEGECLRQRMGDGTGLRRNCLKIGDADAVGEGEGLGDAFCR